MRKIRIYQPGSYQPGDLLELMDTAAHHVGVVLRMKQGDEITLFCGDNYEFSAKIISITKKKIRVEILNVELVD